MKDKYFPLSLLITLLLFPFLNYAQEVDNSKEEQRHRFDYRRIDPNNLPPIEEYTQPKEEVFPLGYGTNHLNKITTGIGIWTELNPKVPRVTYIGLHFVNKDTGWACGQSGAVIKTLDGGSSWTISETPLNNLLLKTYSYNGEIVLVTGYDGIILRSSDAGENFELIPSGVGNGFDLWGVQMLNDTLGWVCGLNQTLLKTTDAGFTWQQINSGLNQHYWSLNFLNEMYGMIACGSGIVLKTTDGGNSWTQTQAGDTRSLYTLDVIDSLHIAAAGADGKNVYSSNGGATWISNQDIPAFTATNWIEFIDANTGYSVQDVYDIRKTTNRGQSWFNPAVNVTSEWHIQLLDDGTGYSCGDDLGDALSFYKRTDGLENWGRLFLNDYFADVFFINEEKGFAISGVLSQTQVLYKTTNGGITWVSIPGAPGGNDLLFLDSLTGFIGSNLIYKTTDGGVTWYVPNGGQGGAGKIFFINQSIGWAIRSNFIYKTTDRGENWFTQFTALVSIHFTSINFVDTLYGWVSGVRPFKTTDGGENWIEQTFTTLWNSDDVYFTDIDTGWFAKYSSINNSLFKTTDGGLNWFGIPEVIGARKLFFFPDPIHWLTLGFSRYYLTNDHGNNWIEFTNDVPGGLSSFYAPTNNLGFAAGSGGLILRYEDTTYVPVELISFEGRVVGHEIVLSWITASELNNLGFNIEKSSDNINWLTIGFVQGKGTTSEKNHYSFIDNEITSEIQYYRIKQIDFDGSFKYSQVVEVVIGIPTEYSLSQNFPNPFNP
ncbi:MAG: YCF48-related protein, partial [Ignavibacteriales bacterium]